MKLHKYIQKYIPNFTIMIATVSSEVFLPHLESLNSFLLKSGCVITKSLVPGEYFLQKIKSKEIMYFFRDAEHILITDIPDLVSILHDYTDFIAHEKEIHLSPTPIKAHSFSDFFPQKLVSFLYSSF